MPGTTFGRELDTAALIALWLAIHGGDPSPEQTTVDDETAILIAAALDRQLTSLYGDTDPSVVEERLKAMGLEVLPKHADRIKTEGPHLLRICFQPVIVKTGKPFGKPICVGVPFHL